MDPYESNYLLALNVSNSLQRTMPSIEDESLPADLQDYPIGLAWMDLSTGAFYTQSCAIPSLSSAITSINPREIVIDEALDSSTLKEVLSKLHSCQSLITRYTPSKGLNSPASWSSMLEHPVPNDVAASFSDEENLAASILLDYGVSQLQDLPLRLQSPVKRLTGEVMALDGSTIRALEIKETIRERLTKGSLLQTIRRTVTKSGARLLSSHLSESDGRYLV
jgi:DNA mismatch repair ATPase MutS